MSIASWGGCMSEAASYLGDVFMIWVERIGEVHYVVAGCR